jgi:flagellar protein FlgJ
MDSRFSAGLGTPDTGAYTDLNRLNQLKVGKDRDSDGNIRKVAQEFESLFLNQMLKVMRSANEVFAEGNFLNSNESKTYQDMHDQQLAVNLSNNGGIGLADVLSRQLLKTAAPRAGSNPFAHLASSFKPEAGAQLAAASTPAVGKAGSAAPASDDLRDDSRLLNQRRLALPARLADRQAAGIAPSETPAVSAAGAAAANGSDLPLAKVDWAPAQRTLGLGAKADRTAAVAEQPASVGKTRFASAEEFIATMLPMAEKAAQKLGVEARYLVAQAALETGWGKSIIKQSDGSTSHNLFGIKTHNKWGGESARVTTTEYKAGKPVKESASFRAYDSYQQSFEDFVSFLQNNGRYQKALSSTHNPEQFAKELQKAGYATDPNYARKISQIARKVQTYQTVASVDRATTTIRG